MKYDGNPHEISNTAQLLGQAMANANLQCSALQVYPLPRDVEWVKRSKGAVFRYTDSEGKTVGLALALPTGRICWLLAGPEDYPSVVQQAGDEVTAWAGQAAWGEVTNVALQGIIQTAMPDVNLSGDTFSVPADQAGTVLHGDDS